MALKISLKAGEKIIVGKAVVRNGNKKAELYVENTVPILREKDIMSERGAVTPCKRIYFVIQLMYIEENHAEKHYDMYWSLVRDVVAVAPSLVDPIYEISDFILGNKYYQALKLAKKLIEYEEEVLVHGAK